MTFNKNPTLGFLLHEVARLLRRRFEQKARQMGLTRSQWQAIAYLSRNEGIHQAGLAELLDIEPITVGRILDKLIERDLVERRQHPSDRRTWQLYLRKEAYPLLDVMQTIADDTRAEAMNGLSAKESAAMMSMLALMKSNLLEVGREPIDKKDGTYA